MTILNIVENHKRKHGEETFWNNEENIYTA